MSQIKRYSVKREGITYGYIESDDFKSQRWRFFHPIQDGKFTMDITSVHPGLSEEGKLIIEKRTNSITFSIDMNKLILTRDDGTTFDIAEDLN